MDTLFQVARIVDVMVLMDLPQGHQVMLLAMVALYTHEFLLYAPYMKHCVFLFSHQCSISWQYLHEISPILELLLCLVEVYTKCSQLTILTDV